MELSGSLSVLNNPGTPLLSGIMARFLGMAFRVCYDLPNLEFLLPSPIYALKEYICTKLFTLAPWDVSSVTAKARL